MLLLELEMLELELCPTLLLLLELEESTELLDDELSRLELLEELNSIPVVQSHSKVIPSS